MPQITGPTLTVDLPQATTDVPTQATANNNNFKAIDSWAGDVNSAINGIESGGISVDPFAVDAKNVTNLAFNDANNRLSWTAPSTVGQNGTVSLSYKVYRNGSLVTTTSNTYYDFGTLPGGEHTFKVEAVWDVQFEPRTVKTSSGESISSANTEKLATPVVSLDIAGTVGTLTIGSVSNATGYSLVVKKAGTQVHTQSFTTAGTKTITYTFAIGYSYTAEVVAVGSTYYQNSSAGTATKNYVQQALATPTVSGISVSDTTVSLTLGTVAGATGYEVRVLDTGGTTLATGTYGTAGAKSLTGTFTEGTTYTLQVWATSDNDDYANTSTVGMQSISFGSGGGNSPIYGVSGMTGTSTALTRTDDAVGMGFTINSSNGTIASDFNSVFPWNEATVEVLNGNKFLKFPDMWFRIGKDSSNHITDIAVSKTQGSSGNWYKVDGFYYGCYGGSESGGVLKSVTGVGRKHTATRANFRTYATANGSGYFQLDLYHKIVTSFLWLIEWATKNSASIMEGKTSVTGSSACNTGGTDSLTTPSGFNTTTKQMRYHYIEDFVGNYREFIDGTVFSTNLYVTANPSNFGDTTTNHVQSGIARVNGGSANNAIAIGWDDNNPFLCWAAETSNDSNYATGYCDQWYNTDSTSPVVGSGAYWSYSDVLGGLFSFGRRSATSANNFIGGRLLYKPL